MDESEKILVEVKATTTAIANTLQDLKGDNDEVRGVAYNAKNKIDNLTKDDYLIIRTIANQQIERAEDRHGITIREWVAILIAALALIVSFIRPGG